MHILLFIFYSLLLGYWVTRLPFFRKSGIRPLFLVLFFGLHVLTGCLQNWVAYHYFPYHGDAWSFFEQSFTTRQELLTDFPVFLKHNTAWVDLPHNILVMIHIILNWFSFDNLYINTLLFSFPAFLGSFALFRTFSSLFPGDFLTASFAILLPSTLFWTSCVYTEGVLYALSGWFFYSLHMGSTTGWNFQRCCTSLFVFLLAFFFRSLILVTLLPAVIVWGLTAKIASRRTLLIVAGIAILFAVVFVYLFPMWSHKLPQYVIAKQQDFQRLEGGSRLSLPVLENSWSSFLTILPWAIRNGLFEPLPGSGGKALYNVFALELIFIWGTGLIALIRRFGVGGSIPGIFSGSNSFIWCCLVYSLSGMILVGMIVPFAGAIVRYRSIYLPFLVVPLFHALRTAGPVKKINIRLSKYIYSPGRVNKNY